jgi:NAD(P)-dependent dehydrogenase (short-subunit alcohol dehydrogenase family)
MAELAGQRAFVTGGGRGIGESVARALAGDGMDVAVSGRTAEQVESVAAAIGGRALVGDVTRREDVERWFAELGPVDLLVANAGSGNAGGPPWEVDLDDWWRTFEVNVLGVHLCCRAAIPGMLERGSGRIVIVGSGSAYLPGASETAYTSSKAAVCRYGETLANALGDRISVFVISPGGAHRDDLELLRRHAVDSAGVRTATRTGARIRGVRRALGPLPARRARPTGGTPRSDRRDPRERLERHPPSASIGFRLLG